MSHVTDKAYTMNKSKTTLTTGPQLWGWGVRVKQRPEQTLQKKKREMRQEGLKMHKPLKPLCTDINIDVCLKKPTAIYSTLPEWAF